MVGELNTYTALFLRGRHTLLYHDRIIESLRLEKTKISSARHIKSKEQTTTH